jgi:2'-5' RNA ligase
MKRIFLAVKTEPDNNFIRLINTFRSVLGAARISWVNPSNFHITLAFLGDIAVDRIPVISELVSICTLNSGPFSLELRGAGLFKSLKDPRILWIGVEKSEALYKLASQLSAKLHSEGFIPEPSSYSPHITIGRIKYIKSTAELAELTGKYRDNPVQEIPVKEIIMYESILKPEGPVYKPLKSFNLTSEI